MSQDNPMTVEEIAWEFAGVFDELPPEQINETLSNFKSSAKDKKQPEDDAIALLEQAARLSPNHETVHTRLARAYLEKGRGEDAYRALSLVRRLYPDNWFAPLGMAVLFAATERPDYSVVVAKFTDFGGESLCQFNRPPPDESIVVIGPGEHQIESCTGATVSSVSVTQIVNSAVAEMKPILAAAAQQQ